MSRWEPNARGRLEQAALELYQDQGYEQTTATEIAERAGLTERTFFRHFTDKREVLFGEQENLLKMSLGAVESAPDTSTPIEIILAALEAMVPALQDRRETVRQRQSVIAANPGLQERELLKLAQFTFFLADALRKRGVTDPEASLAANTGNIVFKTAYERWAAEPEASDLSRLIQETFHQLKSILSG